MTADSLEAWANAAIGLAVSMVAVWALRASGAWQTAPAWAVSAMFFGLSFVRSRILRFAFRRMECR